MLSRATLKSRPSAKNLLRRVLETPELSRQVRQLPAPLLGQLIEQVGLEDAGELIALATTEQLAQIFDEDLWRSAGAGEDERFDAGRFVLWLEILLEGGERAVAARLAELPQDLVTLAFQRHLLVLHFDQLRAELEAGDDEAESAEKAFESCLSEELDEYQLIWRGGDGFDSVLSALLAFDRDHHALARGVLERCAALSAEYIADNGGLYEVLSSEEMLEQDLAAEREDRRAERGYVAPSAALGFLRLARQPRGETPVTEHDPLTRAYFRQLSRTPAESPAAERARASKPGRRRDLARLLVESGVAPAAPRLPAPGGSREQPLLIAALGELRERAPQLFEQRSEELAYLTNVLLTGARFDGRRLRPLEAVELAIECVGHGLSFASSTAAPTPSEAARLLETHPCDGLFRLALGSPELTKPAARPQNAARVSTLLRTLLKQLEI